MEQAYSVSFPKQLAFTLKMQEDEFVSEMRKLTLIKLYEIGKISSGNAAKFLNISRIEFLNLLSKYQVSFFCFTAEDELLNDFENAL